MFIMHKLPASPVVISCSGYAHVLFMILGAINSNFKSLVRECTSESLQTAAGKTIKAAAYEAMF